MSSKRNNNIRLATVLLLFAFVSSAHAGLHQEVQARIDRDVAAGKPIVVHVVVVLADNFFQGIVPVNLRLGNGQNPDTNLYWGARYGVRTWFKRSPAWLRLKGKVSVTGMAKPRPAVLERYIYTTKIRRKGRAVNLYLLAEAWDGRYMKPAMQYYHQLLAGRNPQVWSTKYKIIAWRLEGGSRAHAIVFIGHNGLMDFTLKNLPLRNRSASPRSGMVLACKSRQYFRSTMKKYRVQSLLLTKGLMAPEAYTLDSAIRSWAQGRAVSSIRNAAARAYQRFQKISRKASRWLFYSSEN